MGQWDIATDIEESGMTNTGRRTRDRDEDGRARNARPRDGLGRPLPYDATGTERQPEGIERSPADSISEGQRLLQAGKPFHAHEVFEDAWKLSQGPERLMWRGLAQLAVGVTHAARGNRSGAVALLQRGADGIEPYAADPPYGIDIAGLVNWVNQTVAGLDTTVETPLELAVPQLSAE